MVVSSRTRGVVVPSVAVLLLVVTACSTSGGASPEARSTPVTSSRSTPAPPPTEAPTRTSEPARDAEWEDVVAAVGGGVARISVTSCGSAGSGSGALVADDLVLTAAHVVDGVSTVSVDVAGAVSEASVLGVAPESDLGLLRLDAPVDAPVLLLAEGDVGLASPVAALGFPLEQTGLTLTQGVVSSLDVPVEYPGGFGHEAMIQTDAAVNPGNSGGPLVDRDGHVVGVVSGKRAWFRGEGRVDDTSAEGTAYAVPAEVADQLIGEWLEQDVAVPLLDCGDQESPVPDGVDASIDVAVPPDDPAAAEVAQVLLLQGTGINTGDYEGAFLFFTDGQQEELDGLATWAAGLGSTFWRTISVDDLDRDGASATARVRLRTEQAAEDGPEGQTCTDWVLDYEVQRTGGLWLVDRVRAVGPPSACG